ncbi:unnamed protein product [Periconia digitata]|uniref:Uncharacterized protein n=1 Tax=Periconia digitata TaxID=1303443 RepID=A0A9W4UI16_9PLEO|nr:unnamed protein product [Periconia digitata]
MTSQPPVSNITSPLSPPPPGFPLHLPTDPNQSSFIHDRRAQAIHTPSIPIFIKWRCCQPSCNSAALNPMTNTTHTIEHFVCVVDPTRLRYHWHPGYWHDVCLRCGHRACSDCAFLQVQGTCAWWRDKEEDGRAMWARIGVWDGPGDVERMTEI